MLAAVIALGACGGDDDVVDEAGSGAATSEADASSADEDGNGDDPVGDNDTEDGASGGAVVDPAPAGQATASVDGQNITFDMDLGGGCSISGESITFGLAATDGVSTIAGGMNRSDGVWMGSILIKVPNPDGEGFVQYDPAPVEANILQEGSVAVDGSSMTYSGPIRMQPPNDGSNPPPVAVGDGTISATC